MQWAKSTPMRNAIGEPQIIRLAGMEDARAPWTALAQSTSNVFSTWEWANVWWRHFGAGRTLDLALVRDGEQTAAVLPISVQRRGGIRISRFLGHGVADQLGPVCDPSEIPIAIAGLTAMLPDATVLLAERLPAYYNWVAGLRGKLITEELAPVIDLAGEGDWGSYLGARSANFRQQARRRARKLQGAFGVRFRLADEPSRLQADFDALLTLHTARWGTTLAFEGARTAFHREFAACALERGWLRLWLAEVDGTPVAAWYGFRFAGVESYYQSGRDPGWDRFAVGAGILEHSIREAFADGMREYRLLRGDERYKRRYLSREEGICTVAAARAPLGRTAVTALALIARSSALRRLLRTSE